MRGSAAFRAAVAPGGVLAGPWVRNELWRGARAVPSLDLRFAENKSLVDATTGANLVTFTRASSGTYVGSDGLIKTATTNLLLQSEDFATTWANTESTEASNVETAPNGTLTADKLIPDVGVTSGQFRQDVSKAATATIYTCSVYGKAAEFNRLSIRVEHNGSTGNRADVGFSLSNGSVVSTATALGTFSDASATATFVSAGWYRFTLSFTSSTETSLRVRLFGFDSSLPCNGTSGIYLWGAQLEQSPTVGEYIPTTSTINSAPRFDHNPTTGESLGLLVEESRTNLLLQSNQFDTTWTNSSSSETAASGTAPDGTNTAWELKDTSDVSATAHNLIQNLSYTTGTTYTFSVWMKAGTLTEGGISVPSAAFGAVLINRVNLATGAVITTTAGATTVVTPFANGWYRVSLTATATATASGNTQIRPMNGGTTYIGTGTGTVLIWGAQLEAGSFPTSYIPTTTATVTRSADVASITGANFSSWYRQDEGTVFAETRLQSTVARNAAGIDLNDNSTNNRSIFRAFTTGSFDQYIARSGGSTVATIASANLPSLLLRKSAIAYRVDDFALTAEGLAPNTDTSGAVPVGVNQAFIGSALSGTEFLGGHVRRLTYWPQRLSNTTLQQITQ